MEEIERRGMEEVGIYRVSGVATDIQALKAAFDSSEFNLRRYFTCRMDKCYSKQLVFFCTLLTVVSAALQTTRMCLS